MQGPSKWGAASLSLAACAALALSRSLVLYLGSFPCLSSLLALMSFMTVIIWLKLVGRPTGTSGLPLFTTFVIAIPGAAYLHYTYSTEHVLPGLDTAVGHCIDTVLLL